jgi:hypothetical protein
MPFGWEGGCTINLNQVKVVLAAQAAAAKPL